MKIRKSTEPIQKQYFPITIFGRPGDGKTSLSFTMPKPILHIDTDRGVHRSYLDLRPDSILIDKFDANTVEEIAKVLQSGKYKSVVVDTVGTLLDDYILEYLSRQPKMFHAYGPTRDGWQALSGIFTKMHNLFMSSRLNVCYIAHEKRGGEEDLVSIKATGASKGLITERSDMIGYLYMEGEQRYLSFQKGRFETKDMTGQFTRYKVPQADDQKFANFLSDLLDMCRNKLSQADKKDEEREQDLEQTKSYLDKLETVADFEMLGGLIKEKSEYIQKAIAPLFKEAMKKHGVKFDKKTGKYVEG